MKRVAREFCSTDTLVHPEPRMVRALGFSCLGFSCLGFLCALYRLNALGLSHLLRHSPELEGTPPLVSKGGLFRSGTTALPLSPLGFLSQESRFTNHESLAPKAHA
jgi:hypothetical protein